MKGGNYVREGVRKVTGGVKCRKSQEEKARKMNRNQQSRRGGEYF